MSDQTRTVGPATLFLAASLGVILLLLVGHAYGFWGADPGRLAIALSCGTLGVAFGYAAAHLNGKGGGHVPLVG